MLVLQLLTKECQEGRWDHIKTVVRAKKCPSNNFLSKVVLHSHPQSIPLSCCTNLRHVNIRRKTDYGQAAKKANKCSLKHLPI